MQSTQHPTKHIIEAHGWLALGVFAGVVTAELLSHRISPVLAWLLGGALIGLVPTGLEQQRSVLRIVLSTVTTATVATLAHWLATLAFSVGRP